MLKIDWGNATSGVRSIIKGARVVMEGEMIKKHLQVSGYKSRWSSVLMRHHMTGGRNTLFEVELDE